MAAQTILIAEDDPDIRDGVRILLAGEGYRILEAENGPRALEIFTPEVDLVVLDIMMPGMSGLRVCEELRKISTVPILFLTAKSQENSIWCQTSAKFLTQSPINFLKWQSLLF